MYDIIIIGAGIAGQTAAIYAARKRMNFLLISKDIGGQFFESGEVLNYPGIVKTTGFEFSNIMKKQLDFNGITPRTDEIKKIEKIKEGFKLIGKNEYKTRTVIIATGSHPKKLNAPGEDRLLKRGVTYCSVCDGPLFSGMDIVIIGGGDSALEAVDFTKNIARKIYLIHKDKEFKAHGYLVENLKKLKNVEIITEANTKGILGEKLVTGLKYEKNGKIYQLNVHGVIVEIGRIPNTDFVKGFLKMDKHDHIRIDCYGHTSVEGIFAAGDCTSVHEYQYIISAGEGCTALIKAARYLANKK